MTTDTTTPVFFVSYARNDTDYKSYRKDMKRFIEDLSARVAVKMGVSRAGIYFFDESSIETGTIWRSELSEALKCTKVGVTLYSPSYFTSKWCGKEFQVFLDRAAANAIDLNNLSALFLSYGPNALCYPQCGTDSV